MAGEGARHELGSLSLATPRAYSGDVGGDDIGRGEDASVGGGGFEGVGKGAAVFVAPEAPQPQHLVDGAGDAAGQVGLER